MTTKTGLPAGEANPPERDHPTTSTGRPITRSLTPCVPSELLELTVTHPTVGECVVTVDGELDALTTPLLHTCIRQQLTTAPPHLILDLQPVRFLGSNGLRCLLETREHIQQTPGVQLHLTGLVTRAVARPLQITKLLELFDTYPTLTEARTTLSDGTSPPPQEVVVQQPDADG